MTFASVLLAVSLAAAPTETLLVLSKRDHTLSAVDPATLKVVTRVPVGDDPHEVVASPDGKTAYVSNYGGGSLHTLTVIDLVARKPLAPIELGALSRPHGLAFSAGKVWFTAEGAKVIGSYDPAAQKIDWVLGTGQDRTHMIAVGSDASWWVTTNVSSATATLIEKREARFGPPPGAKPPGGPGGPAGMPPPPTGGPPPGAPGGAGGPPRPK